MAQHGQRRGVECHGDPELRARVRTAANQMVGELLAESRGVECLQPLGPESDAEFASQLIDHELGLIADARAPLNVALRIAFLQAAREALQALVAIRALPETPSQRAGRSAVAVPSGGAFRVVARTGGRRFFRQHRSARFCGRRRFR